MTRRDERDAARYWLDSKIFGMKRSPAGRGDFGDDATVGLNLRRIGASIDLPDEFKPDESFGVFLGQHQGEWVVALKKFDFSGLSGAEVYPNLDALKRRWELD